MQDDHDSKKSARSKLNVDDPRVKDAVDKGDEAAVNLIGKLARKEIGGLAFIEAIDEAVEHRNAAISQIAKPKTGGVPTSSKSGRAQPKSRGIE